MTSRIALALVAVVLVGCTSTDADPLRVSAAASLSEAFDEIAERYEADTGVPVELNLAGSSTLVEQVVRGAPVDVLATADPATMQRAVDAGAVTAHPEVFAANRLQLATPVDAPRRSLGALGDDRLLVGLCAPAVPCGAAARRVLDQAGVTPAPDTEEPDVRALTTKLAAGELDVGLLYATEAAADPAVHGEPLATALDADTQLVIAVVDDTTAGDAANAFVRFVRSPAGAEVLRTHGFEVPA